MAISGCSLYKAEGKVPFLYSAPQETTITEGQKKINLQFKIGSYNSEQLVLHRLGVGMVKLENCNADNKILNCEVTKENLVIIASPENHFYLRYFIEIIPSKIFNLYH